MFLRNPADHSKKKSLRTIAYEQGSDWFEKIPQELREPDRVRTEMCLSTACIEIDTVDIVFSLSYCKLLYLFLPLVSSLSLQ